MRVTIVGAGDVGTGIIERLAGTHEVCVVDTDADRLEALETAQNVRTVEGDGRSLDVLAEAGIEAADILVASTDSDGANVMICGAAKNRADVDTIARVKRIELYETWREAGDAFGIDRMLCVNRLTARNLVRATTLPGALAVDTFADGHAEMAEFAIDAEAPIATQTIEEADRFASLTFAGIIRGEEVIVLTGETVVESGDRIVVIGSPSSVGRFARTLGGRSTLNAETEVVVAGGGQVGVETARRFGDRGHRIRVIERGRERASEVAAALPEATVSEGDATSATVLESEAVGDADIVVCTLGDDETNYLASLLATQLGVSHAVSVVEAAEHVPLFEGAGIEVGARPRDIVAGEIAGIVLGERADSVTLLENDRAEVLEVTIDTDSVLAGESLEDVANHLPDGFVVGAIVRGRAVTPPRGGTVIQTGDHVVALLDSEVIDDVTPKL